MFVSLNQNKLTVPFIPVNYTKAVLYYHFWREAKEWKHFFGAKGHGGFVLHWI